MIKWTITFYLVLIGWVLFRANSLTDAGNLLLDMHFLSGLPLAHAGAWLPLLYVSLAVVLMHLMDWGILRKGEALERRPWLFWSLIVIGHTLCLMIGEPSSEFIYFQF